MIKVVCPECGGAKSSYAVSCSDRGCETGVRACEFCKGEGQVSSDAGERWRAGKAMRDERVKQGRTQQQEAEWLGISPMELNDIEHGRRSLDELKKPTIAATDHSRGRGANREVKKMSLNRVSLIGYLGQDPELRYLPTSGQPVTGFSIATDESFTGKDGNHQERVEWHNIVVFGKLAETCAKYLGCARTKAGLTQEQLAQRLSTNQGNIAQLERNRTQATIRTLKRIAAATGHRLVIDFQK